MADSEENYSQELGSEGVNHVLNKPAQGNTIRPSHLPLQSGISSGKISFLACKLTVFFFTLIFILLLGSLFLYHQSKPLICWSSLLMMSWSVIKILF